MDLFEKDIEKRKQAITKDMPLAARMKPKNLDEFVGQKHIVGPGKLLNRTIESDRISSLILYGPPGTGKNCLAYIISNVTEAHFDEINAVSSNLAELKKLIEAALKRRRSFGKKTIIFIDEIHRFNKAQQDVLLPYIEKGDIVLIGSTTHNPFFSVIPALLSRSLVFELNRLAEEDLKIIIKRALQDKERGLGRLDIKMDKEALSFIAKIADGDARRALNAIEIGAFTTMPDKEGLIHYSLKVAEESIQKKAVIYDKDEDAHYDTISAFIKSMRGSDPDAALYWLAKMLYAGEDPRFIARRIVICAAEDVGNADPQALVVANAAMQVSEFVGMPEARIPLAQATVYIAAAPKSNAAYMGIEKALEDVANGRTFEVPAHLKDANYSGAKRLGRGEGYKYSHSYKGHYVQQEYIPEKRLYYEPADVGYENKIREYLDKLKREAGDVKR
ncbi:MAG TPA: replication-associated recombination protein A [Candidatus Omnitrophica bacterium]|nr:replication-associated recombination protein A [Candidatus Omnitrophota bacterium]